jgi:uncharacterized protein
MRSLAAWGVALTLWSCSGTNAKSEPLPESADDVTLQSYKAQPMRKGRVVLEDAFGGKLVVEVEIAQSPEMRERGMMWRKELAHGKGMLFVFDHEDEHSFWMKNTLIPLDMIFISGDLKVVGVVERAEPKSLGSRTVYQPSKYVLEVPGGWAEKVGLKPGGRVQLHLNAG